MKMAALIVLIPVVTVLFGTAIALMSSSGRAAIFNAGPQGFSEVLYAFASAGNNNGSAFAGLSANTPFYNIAWNCHVNCPICTHRSGSGDGRIACRKENCANQQGTLPTHTPLIYRLVDRCDHHCWSTQLFTCPGIGTHCPTFDAWHRKVVLMNRNKPFSRIIAESFTAMPFWMLSRN